jgi:hypothetical protein
MADIISISHNFPTAAHLDHARKVIACPEIHTDEVLETACQVLMTHGDWLDYERATQALAAQARRQAPALWSVMSFLRGLVLVATGWLVASLAMLWMVS